MTIWIFSLAISAGLVGVALIYWSKVLSENYNDLTVHLRSKSPYLNPPRLQTARLNHTTMLILFRICGAALIAIAVWAVLALSP